MAQIVKAVKMIVGRDKLNAPSRKQPKVLEGEIEIEDDAPKRKPSLEEIDALEVINLFTSIFCETVPLHRKKNIYIFSQNTVKTKMSILQVTIVFTPPVL